MGGPGPQAEPTLSISAQGENQGSAASAEATGLDVVRHPGDGIDGDDGLERSLDVIDASDLDELTALVGVDGERSVEAAPRRVDRHRAAGALEGPPCGVAERKLKSFLNDARGLRLECRPAGANGDRVADGERLGRVRRVIRKRTTARTLTGALDLGEPQFAGEAIHVVHGERLRAGGGRQI